MSVRRVQPRRSRAKEEDGKKSSWLGCLILLSLWQIPVAAQPAVEECSAPALVVSATQGTVTDTFAIADAIEIGELNISMNMTHTFVGQVSNISVESPRGTTVRLHSGGGGYTEDFECVYSDVGRPNPGFISQSGAGIPSPYDCRGCLIQTPASAPDLESFDGQLTDGDWDLTVTAYYAGTLHEWCVIAYEIPPPSNLACTRDPVEVGVLNLEFTAGADYDEVRIYDFAELIDTIPGPFTTGAPTAYTSAALPTPQLAELRLAGVIGDTESAPNTCSVALPAAPIASVGESLTPAAAFGGSSPPFVGLQSFDEDVDIADIIVHVDVAAANIAYTTLAIVSSSGTTVVLHDYPLGGGSAPEIDVSYWQLGVPNGRARYDCDCFMRPSGPGSLLDFVGESTIDDTTGEAAWAFSANLFSFSVTGSVSSWGVDIFDVAPAFPPEGLSCEVDARTVGAVYASWRNAADYESVRIYVNGELIGEEDGPFAAGREGSATTGAQALESSVEVCVQGVLANGAPGPLACCSIVAVVPPIEGLACDSRSGTGIASMAWTNGFPYDEIEVYVDGVLEEAIPGGSTGYDAGPFALPSTVELAVRGVVYVPNSASAPSQCRALLLDAMEIEECAVEPGSSESSSAIEVGHALRIEATEALVHFTSEWLYYEVVALTDPAGTSVTLHETSGPGGSGRETYFVLHSDDGAPFGPIAGGAGFDCACAMVPQLGAMSDYDGDFSEGEWVLSVTNSPHPGTADIQSWCLRIDGCPILPPSGLTCDGSDDSVTLAWVNESDYDTLEVLQDDAVVARLDPDVETYTVTGLEYGRYGFSVSGSNTAVGCGSESRPCRATVGFGEYCSPATPLAAVVAGGTDISIEVLDPAVVAQVEVSFDMEVDWSIHTTVVLTSPDRTALELHTPSNGGEVGDSFQVIWSDGGRRNGPPFDCGFCLMMPEGDPLSTFAGEMADGEWNLFVMPFADATVHLACVAIHDGCTLLPPSAPACTAIGSNIELAWTNNDDYDSLRITRNGATLIDGLPGDTESYVDEQLAPDFYDYRVFGSSVSAGCETVSAPSECTMGIEEYCDATGIELPPSTSGGDIYVEAAIEVLEEIPIDGVRAYVEISHPVNYTLDIDLESPAGVTVGLFERFTYQTGDGYTNMSATFGDGGDSQPPAVYDCGGCLLEPHGPGVMSDFIDDSPVGLWTLSVSGRYYAGTLDEWCLHLFVGCAIPRARIDSCLATGGHAPVELTWSNSDEADSIDIERDGVVIASGLPAGTTEYQDDGTFPGLDAGWHGYRVISVSEDLGCSRASRPCRVAVARYPACSSNLPLTIPGDHTPAVDLLAWSDELLSRSFAAVCADLRIDEVEIDVDVATTNAGSLDIIILSPSLTALQVHDNGGGPSDDLRVTFSDGGVALAVAGTACECLVQPSGPGALADLSGEDPAGDWLLAASSFTTSTLNSWCVAVFPVAPPPPPDDCEGAVEPFLRGDADNSGSVAALVDALYIMSWTFGDGAAPPCLDAADTDDNGTVGTLVDAQRLMLWAFGATVPPPPSPGPNTCGVDPTPDAFICASESPACD